MTQSTQSNSETLYAYLSERGPEGEYRFINRAMGAGTLKPSILIIYQDIHTGRIFVRETSDFMAKMQEIKPGVADVI